MHPYLAVSTTLALIVCSLPSAQAQVTIDATKITCDQFVHSKVGVPRTTAAWLSGFYHGKHDTPIIDKQEFEDKLSKLEQFCQQEKNFKLPVIQAIEQVFGVGK
jgi:hypothetical protein